MTAAMQRGNGEMPKGRRFSLSGGRIFNLDSGAVFDPLAEQKSATATASEGIDHYMDGAREIMRARLMHDATLGTQIPLPRDLTDEVRSLYPRAASLLQTSAELTQANFITKHKFTEDAQSDTYREFSTLSRQLVGKMSELTVAACVYRHQSGTTSDPWVYIPSSKEADKLGVHEGFNCAYDATAVLRAIGHKTGDFTRVQVKTSPASLLAQEERFGNYDPNIAILIASEIARPLSVSQLAIELSLEKRNLPHNSKAIQISSKAIFRALRTHMRQQTLEAKNK